MKNKPAFSTGLLHHVHRSDTFDKIFKLERRISIRNNKILRQIKERNFVHLNSTADDEVGSAHGIAPKINVLPGNLKTSEASLD